MKLLGLEQDATEKALRNGNGEIINEATSELETIHNELKRAIQQKQQLEKELLQVSEWEKRRIGEDLHDVLCQELSALALLLNSTAKEIALRDPGSSEKIRECARIVSRNIVLTRELARGLQAIGATATGLEDALRDLAAATCQNGHITCLFNAKRKVKPKDDLVAFHLYRIAQEAVKNAIKHSGAKNILISLDQNDADLCLQVQDDGKGFSLGEMRGNGLGLHMMQYRANALSGELNVRRRNTGGTDVECRVPTHHAGALDQYGHVYNYTNARCVSTQRQ